MGTKHCIKCKTEKEITNFCRQSKNKDGLHTICRDCSSIVYKNYVLRNYEKERLRHKIYRDVNKEKIKIYYSKNREKTREYFKNYGRKRLYNLSEDQYRYLLEKQNNKCKICLNEFKKTFIDHNHLTGEVRGILCNRCNVFVGYVEKFPELIYKIYAYINP